MLLSSDFLSFPLQLRFRRYLGKGREARADSGTERDNRRVCHREKDNKGGRGHRVLTVDPQRPPVGCVVHNDLVDGRYGAVMKWREGCDQSRRRVAQQHAGAHRHGLRDRRQIIAPLKKRKTEREVSESKK